MAATVVALADLTTWRNRPSLFCPLQRPTLCNTLLYSYFNS